MNGDSLLYLYANYKWANRSGRVGAVQPGTGRVQANGGAGRVQISENPGTRSGSYP